MKLTVLRIALALGSIPVFAACAVDATHGDGATESKSEAALPKVHQGAATPTDLVTHVPCEWTQTDCGEWGDQGGGEGGGAGGGGGGGAGGAGGSCMTGCYSSYAACRTACLTYYGNNVVKVGGNYWPMPPVSSDPNQSYGYCVAATCGNYNAQCSAGCGY
jgi:hypothetical protein